MTRILRTLFTAGLLLAASSAANAEDGAGRTPAPHPAKGKGEHCVADTAFMRRYHMMMMYDHRTEAVHQGVRTPQYSIAGCVSCHAVKGADGQPVSFASPKHFCRSCHDYEAVRIDCFECHNSRPEAPAKSADAGALVPEHDADTARLAAFLQQDKPDAALKDKPAAAPETKPAAQREQNR